jgi:hypothetical protein
MGFTQGAYDDIIGKLEAAPSKIVSLTNKIISDVNGALGWIPLIGDAVKAALNKLKGLVEQVCAKLNQLLQGAGVPPAMWNAGSKWLDIQRSTSNVASTIGGQMQSHGNEWQGIAGGKYNTGVSEQSGAAGTMSSIAGGMQSNCSSVGNAGFGFYSAIAVGVAGIVGGLITCAAAGWTGVGAIAGLCVAIAGALIGFGGAVVAVQFGIDSAQRNFQGLTDVGSSFPSNAWPLATAQ